MFSIGGGSGVLFTGGSGVVFVFVFVLFSSGGGSGVVFPLTVLFSFEVFVVFSSEVGGTSIGGSSTGGFSSGFVCAVHV